MNETMVKAISRAEKATKSPVSSRIVLAILLISQSLYCSRFSAHAWLFSVSDRYLKLVSSSMQRRGASISTFYKGFCIVCRTEMHESRRFNVFLALSSMFLHSNYSSPVT